MTPRWQFIYRLRRGRTPQTLVLILLAGIVATIPPTASGQIASRPAEQFVLDQVKINGVADLNKSDLPNKAISHKFLEDLITNSQPVAAVAVYGLTLRGATIDGRLSVGSVTIPYPLTFDNCKFEEGFDLSSNIFSRDFLLINSVVGSSSSREEPPTFQSSRFANKVSLDSTAFHNGVDFTGASIDGGLESDDVRYESEQDEADFNNVKVGGQASFQRSHFKGGLDLSGAELANLVIDGGAAGSSNPPNPLNLLIDHATISKGLAVQNLTLSGFGARMTDVEGETDLHNVQPQGRTFFNGSHFQALNVTGIGAWLKDAQKIQLDGLKYDSIEFPDSKTNPPEKDWLALINGGPFSPQPYEELEQFLRNRRGTDYADQVYFSMRRKERKGLSALRKSVDWIEEFLVGYGRQLWMAALIALGLVIVGALIFQRHRMEQDDDKCTDNWYNPFWFSLDLLSPIDLGVSKKWRAKHNLLRNYAQLHRVAGWILIPLIVAAVTGVIK